MARGASKKVASNNGFLLSLLRYGFLITNTVSLLARFWFWKKSFAWKGNLLWGLTEAVSLGLWIVLERMAVRNDDLGQAGLTQYLFDIIYITWTVHLLTALVGSWFWCIYSIIPGYAVFLVYQKILLPFVFGGQSPFASFTNWGSGSQQQQQQGQGQGQEQEQSTLSKRQQKLQARAEKGDPRVQARKR